MLSQYIWPDGAPTAIYADQLADRLFERGMPVELVGGSGTYRISAREAPRAPITRLAHFEGSRGRLLGSYVEYRSVSRAFVRYVRENVGPADVVVVSSAPPTTLTLAPAIRKQGAVGVYWLQDYYPEVLRGLREYPAILRWLLSRYWDRALAKWNHVVKIGENLGYFGINARTIRNWPTLSFPGSAAPSPKTALYTGNLGYCHDIDCFIAECQRLVDAGYEVTVLGDGPGIAQLPGWIKSGPPYPDAAALRAGLLAAEVHLVAAHPQIRRALFPSKLWNSVASGRKMVFSGFAGEMAEELEESLRAPYSRHLDNWCDFLESVFHSRVA